MAPGSQAAAAANRGAPVFVAGLGPETTAATLWTLFSEMGEVLEAVVHRSRQTGRSTFATMEGRRRAFEELEDRKLEGFRVLIREHPEVVIRRVDLFEN